jgi:hypothetical protein
MKKFNKCDLYLADEFSLPICHLSRPKYSNIFEDKASWGYCAAKKERYSGFKVLLSTTEQGIPIDYAIDGANIDERKLLTRTIIPRYTTIIADKGFISNDLQEQLKQYDITLITPKGNNVLNKITGRFTRLITSVRKRIDTTISQLNEMFNITKTSSFHGNLLLQYCTIGILTMK